MTREELQAKQELSASYLQVTTKQKFFLQLHKFNFSTFKAY